MGTKGTWQRPSDRRAWDDNYRRIFRQKAKPSMARKKVRTMGAGEISAKVNRLAAQLDDIYVNQIESASEERLERLKQSNLYGEALRYCSDVVDDLREALRP